MKIEPSRVIPPTSSFLVDVALLTIHTKIDPTMISVNESSVYSTDIKIGVPLV